MTNGWLALNGALDWQYQKDAAGRAVRDLTGVRGVTLSRASCAQQANVVYRVPVDRLLGWLASADGC